MTPPKPNTTNSELTDVQKSEIAHNEALRGIDLYQQFKGSEDEIERTVAWIHQLSPWNIDRGVEHLRSLIASKVAEARLNELKHRADDTIGRMYRLDRSYADQYVKSLQPREQDKV